MDERADPAASEAPRGSQAPQEEWSPTGASVRWIEAGAAVAVALLTLASVWCVDVFLSNDGPRHVFAIHAANHLYGSGGWARFLDPGTPLTSLGFYAVYAPLDRFLPWQLALRIALSALVLLWVGGALALVRALRPERAALGVALAALAFQWTLYMGFLPFYAATALALWLLAFALRRRTWDGATRALLSALLLAVALAHVVAAWIAGLVLAGIALGRAGRAGAAHELLRLAALALPAALVAAGFAAWGLAALATPDEGGASAFVWPVVPATLARCFAAGPAWRAALPLLLAVLSLVLAFALRRPGMTSSAHAGGASHRDDASLRVVGALLLGAAALSPLHLPGWEFFAPRLLPLGVVALLVTLPLERLAPPRRQLASLALCAWALGAASWPIAQQRALAARSAEALAGLDAPLARDGPRLPILFGDGAPGSPLLPDPRIPYARPLVNLGHLYALAQGGLVPHNFAVNPALHHVLYRDEWRQRYPAVPPDLDEWIGAGALTDPSLRAALATHAAGHASVYQDVILWGRPEDAALFLHRGYEAEFQQDGLLLARFRGCPLRLRVAGAALPSDAVVEMGWYPLTETARRVRVADAGAAQEVPIGRAPCGAVWLRLASARGDGAAAPVCAGADSQRRLVVPSAQQSPVVTCTLPAAAGAASAAPPRGAEG